MSMIRIDIQTYPSIVFAEYLANPEMVMHPFQRLLDILGWTAFAVFAISFTVFLFSNDEWMTRNLVPLTYGIFGGFGVAAFRIVCWVMFPPKELMQGLRRGG